MASTFLSICLLFITASTADGWLCYSANRCVFNSTELSDIEFISSYYYNKLEFVRFSSSVGKFVGYTEFGVKTAETWNQDQSLLAAMRAERERYCQPNVGTEYKAALTKTVKPFVRLHSVEPPAGEHAAMLVCSVYSFYPKPITVSWTRDGREVPSGTTSTEEMEDGDWFYQAHSYLMYTPRSGEKISCVVEHASLKQPLVIDWDPAMPDPDTDVIIIVASELILGLLLFLAGLLIYCWRKIRDQSPTKPIQNRSSAGWPLGPTKLHSGRFYGGYDR